jgi:hypothetical protein
VDSFPFARTIYQELIEVKSRMAAQEKTVMNKEYANAIKKSIFSTPL